jgi:hypothetical protein
LRHRVNDDLVKFIGGHTSAKETFKND